MNKISTLAKSSSFEIRALVEGDETIADRLNHGLIEHNNKYAGGPYRSKIIGAYKNGTLAGGIHFRWYKQHASIKMLWVEEGSRGQGLGKALLAAAEHELCKLNCRRIIVDTISFQSPDFYCRNGYDLIATTPDYLENAERLTFGKYLPEGSSDE